ncbi:MAG: prepilin-type N-terminal cleavage/methylation domain-containing protein [Syntrophales bacterium]|nr:prepilin-type N-terminal cleavage/methylation domain-containing protein [Syntrophales bacterium]
MSVFRYNDRGLSLVEVVIALMLTSVAVMAILSMQPTAWKTAARSDMMGRASGILYAELLRQEAWIMNPCNTVTTTGTNPAPVAFFASGAASAQAGDLPFTVTTTITNIGTNTWRVTVRVAWPNHPGISESLTVTRQEGFRTPGGCS